MAGKTRSFFLSLAIITVLVLGAVSPAIAYADDRKPPDPSPTAASNGGATTASEDTEATAAPTSAPAEATAKATSAPTEATTAPTTAPTEVTVAPTSAATEATTQPSSTSVEVTAQATGTPAPTTTEATSTPDEAPTQVGSQGNTSSSGGSTTPPPTDVAPATTTSTPAPDSTILNQVPKDTTVTVLDAQGNSQPLATQDAANAVATGDPIWCPQGQAPTPGTNGCTNSFNSFKALLTFLSGNASYQGAGTIYIQSGVYITGGTNDFNAPQYDLSNIRNSALTITGGWDVTTGTVDPTSTSSFRVPFLIGTSTNPWGGSISINNLTIDKSDGTSLVIYTQSDITLSNVNITNAHNNGAGAELNAGGNVTINNSTFIRNKKAGAIINAAGNVSVADSTFSNFTSHRLQITGLDITSGGNVSLANVEANNNRQVGTNINAGGQVTIASSFFSGNKAFVGTGPSSGFTGYGLQIVTPDAITLSSVTASDNFLWGGSLQAGSNVSITDSIFNANTTASPHFIDDTGLLVKSGGNVSLNNTQANDNRLIGATINATGDVTITNSTFTNNKGVTLDAHGKPIFHGYGLQVVTPGNIFISQVDASNNTLFGAHLEAGSQVSVFNSNFSNETSGSTTDQTGRGLEIISGGNVILSNVSVSGNQTFGASIQSGGTVLLDTIAATNNGADGVDVQGNCTMVVVNAGVYSNNGGYGLSINSASLNQSGSPVFSNNTAGDIFQNPGSCVFPSHNTNGGAGVTNTSTGSSTLKPAQSPLQDNSVPVALQQGVHLFQGTNFFIGKEGFFSMVGLNSKGITFNGLLVNSGPANEDRFGPFVGRYTYIYSNSVLHIIALLPLPSSLAMAGS